MSGAVTIRRAGKTDIEAMVALLRILFGLEKDFTFCPEKQQTGLEMMLNNDRGLLLVAEQNHRVIGMCSGQLMISTAEGGYSVLVEDLVVDRPWRNRGTGTALLTALHAWATENRAVRLQLLADRSNATALEFYTGLHWRKTKLICLCKRVTTLNKEN